MNSSVFGELSNLSEEENGAYSCPYMPNSSTPVTFWYGDSYLELECPGEINCTALTNFEASTIVSPIVLSLTGVTGHIIALVYLYASRRRQQARTVFYLMLTTLIWTDLLGKVLTTPPALISYGFGRWVGGKHMCLTHGYTMSVIGMITHFLVSAMAIERFLGIRHGYFYNKNVTPTRTKFILRSLWLFSLSYCALPFIGIGRFALQFPGSWCFVNLHTCAKSSLADRIFVNLYGTFNFINVIVIITLNVVVVGTLLKMRITRLRPVKSFQQHRYSSRKQKELELQMVIVLVVITIVFAISWLPLDFLIFGNQIWPHTEYYLHKYDLSAIRLASINQILDPWTYIIFRVILTRNERRYRNGSLRNTRMGVSFRVQQLFRSQIWKHCHLALTGRGFSYRGESLDSGGSFTNSFLGKRKSSRLLSNAVTHDKGHSRVKHPCIEVVQQENKGMSATVEQIKVISPNGEYVTDSGLYSCSPAVICMTKSEVTTPVHSRGVQEEYSSEKRGLSCDVLLKVCISAETNGRNSRVTLKSPTGWEELQNGERERANSSASQYKKIGNVLEEPQGTRKIKTLGRRASWCCPTNDYSQANLDAFKV